MTYPRLSRIVRIQHTAQLHAHSIGLYPTLRSETPRPLLLGRVSGLPFAFVAFADLELGEHLSQRLVYLALLRRADKCQERIGGL